MLNQTAALLDLPLGEFIAAPGKRVRILTKFDTHRRALQPKRLTVRVDEVAAIGFRHLQHLVAVNDDDRRVAAALMGIAQLDASTAHERWLVRLDSRFEDARQLRCWQLLERSLGSAVGFRQQVADAGAVQRRDEVALRKIKER